MIFSEKLLLLFSGKGDVRKFRTGHVFAGNPKPPRADDRSGTPFVARHDDLKSIAEPRNLFHSIPPAFVAFKSDSSSCTLKSFVLQFLCVLIALACISCGGSGTGSSSKNETITVDITPATAVVGLGGTVQFTCLESGNADTNVTWEVDDVVGGDASVGTISRAGLYTAPTAFSSPSTVTVTCIAQANGTSAANVPVTLSSNVSISVSPASADLQFTQTQQFSATVTGSSNTGVTWQAGGVSGGNSTFGTITSGGLYTAPSKAATTPLAVTVSAVAQVDTSKSGMASVTIHGGFTVAVTPSVVTVPTFGSQQFAATVSGTSNTGVTWEVNGVAGGSGKTGTISTSGLYSAPNSVPTASSNNKSVTAAVSVSAVSQADSTAQGTATVTLQSRQQGSQATPISLGVSGGNANDSGNADSSPACCGGTLGALVSRDGNQYLLSTSHVLARSDAGSLGDAVIQPGLIDSGCTSASATTVANLSQFVNLENPPQAPPFVDAALAQVVSGQVDPLGTILELGATSEDGQPLDAPVHAGKGVTPSIGLTIAKSGRSTGLTCSSITAINAVVNVQYQKGCGTGPSFTATFTDLVIVDGQSFSADGDSGALLVTESGADPVALLVASSDTETVAAPVSDVLAALADPNTAEQPVFVGTASSHVVAGCSLAGSQSTSIAAASQITTNPTKEMLQVAALSRDSNATNLFGHPQVRAIGVAASLDEPGQAAILLVVSKGASAAGLPSILDGHRTRILQADNIPHTGVLSLSESAALVQAAVSSSSRASLTAEQVSNARNVQAAHLSELLRNAGVQGVAITSSADNPSEAALLVLVVRGSRPDAIPAIIEGLRTRIRESSPFRPDSRAQKSNAACRLHLSHQRPN